MASKNVHIVRRINLLDAATAKRGEGVLLLLTELPSPRIARQGTACLISIREKTRKARIEKFELDEGFQPCPPPLPNPVSCRSGASTETPAPRDRPETPG